MVLQCRIGHSLPTQVNLQHFGSTTAGPCIAVFFYEEVNLGPIPSQIAANNLVCEFWRNSGRNPQIRYDSGQINRNLVLSSFANYGVMCIRTSREIRPKYDLKTAQTTPAKGRRVLFRPISTTANQLEQVSINLILRFLM